MTIYYKILPFKKSVWKKKKNKMIIMSISILFLFSSLNLIYIFYLIHRMYIKNTILIKSYILVYYILYIKYIFIAIISYYIVIYLINLYILISSIFSYNTLLFLINFNFPIYFFAELSAIYVYPPYGASNYGIISDSTPTPLGLPLWDGSVRENNYIFSSNLPEDHKLLTSESTSTSNPMVGSSSGSKLENSSFSSISSFSSSSKSLKPLSLEDDNWDITAAHYKGEPVCMPRSEKSLLYLQSEWKYEKSKSRWAVTLFDQYSRYGAVMRVQDEVGDGQISNLVFFKVVKKGFSIRGKYQTDGFDTIHSEDLIFTQLEDY